MNWAEHGACLSAVDLNPVAVAQTRCRFELFGLPGHILQADAHALPFGDQAFDYSYSWGVLHHTPDLARSVAEFFRVLRGGGGFGIMLYHRESLFYRYLILYLEGLLHAESRFSTPVQLASRYTDGAAQEGNPYTWPVSRREVEDLFSPYSTDLTIKVLGVDLDAVFRLLWPKVGACFPTWIKKSWARRWGWSFWISGTKRS